MTLEQKLLEAKSKRRNYFIKVGIGFIAISLLCLMVLLFVSPSQFINTETEVVLTPTINKAELTPLVTPDLPDEQLRQAYITALGHFENSLKPALNKIDLVKWNKARSEQLTELKNKALAAFTAADYASAVNNINSLTQLTELTLAESQQQFVQALSKAQTAYDLDQYNEAKSQITQAKILDSSSLPATELSTKIDKLPEILHQLELINTARTNKQINKELSLIKDLLKLAPERTSATQRKQELINIIRQRSFNANITQSRLALDKGKIELAKQKLAAAKKIYPHNPKVANLTQSVQQLEANQRFKTHQLKAQQAITADDWNTAKTQLASALKQQSSNSDIKSSLARATSIVALNNELKQALKSPYQLSNKRLSSSLQGKIKQAAALSTYSPSLGQNAASLTRLIKQMNSKIAVTISSDEETFILVRGVGTVGKTLSKTIQLAPGKYTFEGKRKGFKSKLINILIPYNKAGFQLTIRCDEPI